MDWGVALAGQNMRHNTVGHTVARKGHYNIFFLLKLSRDNFSLSRDKFKLSRDNFELPRDN